MIAMGSNRFNKLNLSTRMGFFAHVKNPKVLISEIIITSSIKIFMLKLITVFAARIREYSGTESGEGFPVKDCGCEYELLP